MTAGKNENLLKKKKLSTAEMDPGQLNTRVQRELWDLGVLGGAAARAHCEGAREGTEGSPSRRCCVGVLLPHSPSFQGLGQPGAAGGTHVPSQAAHPDLLRREPGRAVLPQQQQRLRWGGRRGDRESAGQQILLFFFFFSGIFSNVRGTRRRAAGQRSEDLLAPTGLALCWCHQPGPQLSVFLPVPSVGLLLGEYLSRYSSQLKHWDFVSVMVSRSTRFLQKASKGPPPCSRRFQTRDLVLQVLSPVCEHQEEETVPSQGARG